LIALLFFQLFNSFSDQHPHDVRTRFIFVSRNLVNGLCGSFGQLDAYKYSGMKFVIEQGEEFSVLKTIMSA
jgi:hypothetical protein